MNSVGSSSCTNADFIQFQLAGVLWRVNFLKIQTLIHVPKFVSKLFSATLGRLLDTSDPVGQNLKTFGATLELQRQENLERLEQQLLMQSIRNSQNGRNIHIGRPQPQVNGCMSGENPHILFMLQILTNWHKRIVKAVVCQNFRSFAVVWKDNCNILQHFSWLYAFAWHTCNLYIWKRRKKLPNVSNGLRIQSGPVFLRGTWSCAPCILRLPCRTFHDQGDYSKHMKKACRFAQ